MPTRHPITLALLTLLAVAAIWIAGWRVTPVDVTGTPRLLTWADWTLAARQAAVSDELGRLRAAATNLAALLNAPPNAVQAGLALEHVQAITNRGTPELAPQRAALQTAAINVQMWAAGTLDFADAADAVNNALALLQ